MVRIIPTPPFGPNGEPWYLDDPPDPHPDPLVQARIDGDIFNQVRWLCGEIEAPELDAWRESLDDKEDETPDVVCGTPDLIEQEERRIRQERERAKAEAAREAESTTPPNVHEEQGDLFRPR